SEEHTSELQSQSNLVCRLLLEKKKESAILEDERQKTVASAVVLANSLGRAKIIVFTRHGAMARYVSNLRTEKAPIFAFTSSAEVCRHLLICWGIYPVKINFTEDPNATIEVADKFLREVKLPTPTLFPYTTLFR